MRWLDVGFPPQLLRHPHNEIGRTPARVQSHLGYRRCNCTRDGRQFGSRRNHKKGSHVSNSQLEFASTNALESTANTTPPSVHPRYRPTKTITRLDKVRHLPLRKLHSNFRRTSAQTSTPAWKTVSAPTLQGITVWAGWNSLFQPPISVVGTGHRKLPPP